MYNSPMPLVTLSHVSVFSAAGIRAEPIVLQIVIRRHASIQLVDTLALTDDYSPGNETLPSCKGN